ncbi:MAG TPA: hypothetical protein PLP33_24500 [Leptospiraceae bacterium]|nr:hypothetical protein [Leptospiraceae bacterium]
MALLKYGLIFVHEESDTMAYTYFLADNWFQARDMAEEYKKKGWLKGEVYLIDKVNTAFSKIHVKYFLSIDVYLVCEVNKKDSKYKARYVGLPCAEAFVSSANKFNGNTAYFCREVGRIKNGIFTEFSKEQ